MIFFFLAGTLLQNMCIILLVPCINKGVPSPSIVMDVFYEVEWTTNDFVVKRLLGTCYLSSSHA